MLSLEAIRHRYLRHVVAPVFRCLGLRLSTAVASRLARGICGLNTPGRRCAEARLLAAVAEGMDINGGLPRRDVVEIIAAMYEQTARFWTEALFIPKRLSETTWQQYVQVVGEDGLRALADSRQGCLLATAYFGNLAAGACSLGQIFRPVYVVVDRLTQPALASWQKELYSHPQVRPIERQVAAAALPRILQEGGAVLMVCEHHRRQGCGIDTTFLGNRLNCYPTLGRLARWFDVPIGVVTCRRETPLFSFTLELLDVITSDPARADDGDVVRRTIATLERAILKAPEQYLWSMPAYGDDGSGQTNVQPVLATGTEIVSASSRIERRKSSAWQSRSAAGRRPAGWGAAAGRVPKVLCPEPSVRQA